MCVRLIAFKQANPELWVPSGNLSLPFVIPLGNFSGSFQGFYRELCPCALKVNTVLVSKLFLLCTVAHVTHVPVAWFTPYMVQDCAFSCM